MSERVASLVFMVGRGSSSNIINHTSLTIYLAGFEMFSDPNNRNSGYITWVADGKKSWTMYPAAVGPLSSMNIGQRLISEEPMAMVCLTTKLIYTILLSSDLLITSSPSGHKFWHVQQFPGYRS